MSTRTHDPDFCGRAECLAVRRAPAVELSRDVRSRLVGKAYRFGKLGRTEAWAKLRTIWSGIKSTTEGLADYLDDTPPYLDPTKRKV